MNNLRDDLKQSQLRQSVDPSKNELSESICAPKYFDELEILLSTDFYGRDKVGRLLKQARNSPEPIVIPEPATKPKRIRVNSDGFEDLDPELAQIKEEARQQKVI